MLDANYQKHFKVIGKLTYLYDNAGDDLDTIKGHIAALFDQVATGVLASYDATLLMAGYASTLDRAARSSSDARASRQATCVSAVKAYLIASLFRDDLTNTPTDVTSAKAVAEALQFELEDDSKTMTTETTTGMVNFLDEACGPTAGPTVGWSTEADASADYKDSVYVVTGQL